MSSGGRIAVFVAVVSLLLVGAAGVGFITADRPAEAHGVTVDNEYYIGDNLIADAELEPRSGEIDLERGSTRTVAIATDGPVSELDPIVTALVDAGHEVRIVGDSASLSAGSDANLVKTLENVDAFLVVGNTAFDDDEREAIEAFVESGGRFVVATDDASADGELTSLTSGFGLAVADGYLYDMHDNDANYQRVYGSGAGPLSEADRLVFARASPVVGNGTTIASVEGEQTRYSTTRERGSFDVALRRENVMLIGDSDVYSPLNYNRGDNHLLVTRTLEFLTGGPVDPHSVESDG